MAAKALEWRPGPAVCRCCFAEGCYKDISTEYFWMGKREVYSEMLLDTFDVSISYALSGPNSNSRLICEPCISRLRDATDFKRQVLECERTFMQHLTQPGQSDSTAPEASLDNEKDEVKLERIKLESKLDDDFDDRTGFPDDDDDDDMDDQPLTTLATKVPKKETMDISDLLDNAKPEKRKSTTKPKPTPAKKPKKVEAPKPSVSKQKAKPVEKKKKGSQMDTLSGKKARKLKENVSDRQMRRRRRANNELPEESEKRIAKTMMRRNALTILENSTAWAFRWFHSVFFCSYCDAKFVDIGPLKEHIRSHLHAAPTKKIFSKLTENNMLKVDVSDLKCRLCCESFTNLEILVNHLANMHGKGFNKDFSDGVLPFKLETNGFYCQKCFEYFPSFAKINEHMNLHYQNYICDSCGKAFVSKSRFRTHVQSHEIGTFPCGECDEILDTRAARMCHKLKVHKKGIRYTCPRCPEVFTTYYARAKHLVDGHAQEKRDYICNICRKLFDTSCKRAAHIRTTHKTVEKRFECSFCKWHFVSKSKLKRHVLTHGFGAHFSQD